MIAVFIADVTGHVWIGGAVAVLFIASDIWLAIDDRKTARESAAAKDVEE